ncbi:MULTISPECIES: YggS family pyridoxal phosphate-dependent enzyme [unclassified Saccharopolyspora]|uniref:YggS family pyridoxal phosphate-dependent enzyme n=1 Tax=unclassified Saccharopolyspora TaxID=2646250 RepID=UPI001CD5E91F|nr:MULTISPECIES: YggS family pyridoxal phosphate-dependent enzyme [unclassified Saccharopolyspora]MCA1187322.1 YggS family pyridoxal phosphate-dependent enzyme [Saccharopolyspora sp. 6T]MCA1193624.1 YggS family pyridoxal phosphate-dependent enzyme [Saccharopolyspora sp. 6V]MCA1227724.1 YggS family pyridoxal phosphate-dependent enzyme [Saccharopolyspora sp. 6M]MCA1280296.1 YggS family pyridoxal phosphate-dependent enzyme [Saccharopolyspora sp. 7B]
MSEDDERRAELAESLSSIRQRLAAACAAAGRPVADVQLLAVTKTFPARDVALLADLGLVSFAENREQEARPKVAELAALRPAAEARWHMVGQLQRNKARSVARWADVVESADSPRLVEALAGAVRNALDAGERTRPLEVLVQVNLDEAAGRGGCPAAEVPALAADIAARDELRLRGVMAVAPQNTAPDVAFDTLSAISTRLRRDHPEAGEISAGMSGDLESAVAHGSTRVRVGTALLGGRRLISP